jgi:hypothetical protein
VKEVQVQEVQVRPAPALQVQVQVQAAARRRCFGFFSFCYLRAERQLAFALLRSTCCSEAIRESLLVCTWYIFAVLSPCCLLSVVWFDQHKNMFPA